eukprot:g9447.t1
MSALAQFSQQQKASSSRSWGVFGGAQSGSDFVDLEGGGASSSSSAASRGVAFFGGLRDKVVSTAQDYTPMRTGEYGLFNTELSGKRDTTVRREHAGPFLSFVFASERAAFGVGYCLSFVGVLYASLVQKSYFLTLFCVVAELVSLSYLLLSYVPGGTRFLNFVFSMVLSGCKMLCGRCLGGGDG